LSPNSFIFAFAGLFVRMRKQNNFATHKVSTK
jgi:hypothetical protein